MTLTDQMTMAKPNPELQKKIFSRLVNIHPDECFQCMRCTSGCTSLKLLELKPHEITLLVTTGFIDELLSSDIIWTCAACLKCRERCPQKASPYNTIMILRNLAVEKESKVPEAYMKAMSQILETGLMQQETPVLSREAKPFNRQTLGLPKLHYPKPKLQEILMKILGG
ncbi:4Fe-4S dicluster domain-containing protein [Candidatus Bathyarchaeota archaeon]|nr:4Fe-4S dicluster domain-containing protein [Candidatus Bathyarchaeota archaeon]